MSGIRDQGSECIRHLKPETWHLKVGFPIRKSTDQSLLAAPRGLSQRTTSFIACVRQGIHRMPLRHLITPIADARQEAVNVNEQKTSDHLGDVRNPAPDRHDSMPRPAAAPDNSSSSRCQTTGQPRPAAGKILFLRLVRAGTGGARRDRTDDLLLAKQALSQLSYGPGPDIRCRVSGIRKQSGDPDT